MQNKGFKYPDTKAYQFIIDEFNKRGITLHDLAKIVHKMEIDYIPELTVEKCARVLINEMHKRELMNNVMVGLELDRNDAGVFGVDEVLALQIANIYGTIGSTNFGYLDRVKYGLIKKFDEDKQHVNTFLDDLLGAIVAAACAKLAHEYA